MKRQSRFDPALPFKIHGVELQIEKFKKSESREWQPMPHLLLP